MSILGLALKIELVQIILQFFQLKAIKLLFKNFTCGIKRRPSWQLKSRFQFLQFFELSDKNGQGYSMTDSIA